MNQTYPLPFLTNGLSFSYSLMPLYDSIKTLMGLFSYKVCLKSSGLDSKNNLTLDEHR